ncbi:hypothetical protein [Bradyrhizobium icense]|uniref:Uncharacterized protein n=1 Tax=Bradyrhizobium icense TaxID=1274631 RepID=A0A1B1UJH3_9BRAD|nr:hypothetical protein [Bradyrhizobium icense]ANW02932.1 hypothetical protein LMTR13_25000 [Bradyrhizobium icense]
MVGIVYVKQASNFAQIRGRSVANNSMRHQGADHYQHLRSVRAANSAGAKRRARRVLIDGRRALRKALTFGADHIVRSLIAYSPGRHTGEQPCVGDRNPQDWEGVWTG